jgi:hypothetical protein
MSVIGRNIPLEVAIGLACIFPVKWMRPMAKPNIEQFCKQLAGKSDAVKRRSILRLLADEDAKLTALEVQSTTENVRRPKERKGRA